MELNLNESEDEKKEKTMDNIQRMKELLQQIIDLKRNIENFQLGVSDLSDHIMEKLYNSQSVLFIVISLKST